LLGHKHAPEGESRFSKAATPGFYVPANGLKTNCWSPNVMPTPRPNPPWIGPRGAGADRVRPGKLAGCAPILPSRPSRQTKIPCPPTRAPKCHDKHAGFAGCVNAPRVWCRRPPCKANGQPHGWGKRIMTVKYRGWLAPTVFATSSSLTTDGDAFFFLMLYTR